MYDEREDVLLSEFVGKGLVVIDGKTWQIARPSNAVVQIPTYGRYDVLRDEVRLFITKAVEGTTVVSMAGIVETMELFCLVYDPNSSIFYLSLCYGEGKSVTYTYDKLEYCVWGSSGTDDEASWDLGQVTEEIINDLDFPWVIIWHNPLLSLSL